MVLGDRQRRSAISRLVSPSTTKATISCSRAVRGDWRAPSGILASAWTTPVETKGETGEEALDCGDELVFRSLDRNHALRAVRQIAGHEVPVWRGAEDDETPSGRLVGEEHIGRPERRGCLSDCIAERRIGQERLDEGADKRAEQGRRKGAASSNGPTSATPLTAGASSSAALLGTRLPHLLADVSIRRLPIRYARVRNCEASAHGPTRGISSSAALSPVTDR